MQDLIAVYQDLGRRSDYAIHLGLTEAGMGSKGIVASSAALGILLQEGIGDTIRVSLTPEPGGDRTVEVKVAQEILQTMGFRTFVPLVAACPGCGRTTSTTFQELAGGIQKFIIDSMPEWKKRYPGVEALNVAVMGCIVNGPGESKHADIGISLPGTGEAPAAPVFIDGKKAMTLRGPTVSADFKQIVIDYIEKRYGAGAEGGGVVSPLRSVPIHEYHPRHQHCLRPVRAVHDGAVHSRMDLHARAQIRRAAASPAVRGRATGFAAATANIRADTQPTAATEKSRVRVSRCR